MMYHKAQCYSSTSIAAEVLAAKNPRKTKSLGRKVDMTSDQGKRWEQEKYAVVEKGNLLKFRQHGGVEDGFAGDGREGASGGESSRQDLGGRVSGSVC